MLVTKLSLGFGIVLLGTISLSNPSHQDKYIDFNSKSISISELQNPGKEIYTDFCMRCHGANGKGDTDDIPPLASSDWLTKKRSQSIAAVKFGLNGEIIVNKKKYNKNMASMGLSNQEVADVMNYIMTSWGNKQSKIVTVKEVEAVTY